MRNRRSLCQYGLVVLGCVVSLILSAIFCFNSCEPGVCDERFCNKLIKQMQDGYIVHSKSWINNPLTLSKQKTTFIVILILSSPSNMAQRDTIRQTWLKRKKKDPMILHFFAIGSGRLEDDERKTIDSESNRFKDMLLLPNINDSYHSLTLKLLEALVWLNQNIEFNFLMKVDDDSFVRMDVIKKELNSVRNKKRLYWGFFNGRANVKKSGPWEEREWVLCDFYLPYALGGGYVISSDLVHFVATNRQYLKLYGSEDVSMGVWLAPLDVHRIHDTRFDTEYKSRGCFNSYIVTHKQSIEQMREKYWLLKEKGRLCSEEIRQQYSYIYNWKVPPSKCCVRNNASIP